MPAQARGRGMMWPGTWDLSWKELWKDMGRHDRWHWGWEPKALDERWSRILHLYDMYFVQEILWQQKEDDSQGILKEHMPSTGQPGTWPEHTKLSVGLDCQVHCVNNSTWTKWIFERWKWNRLPLVGTPQISPWKGCQSKPLLLRLDSTELPVAYYFKEKKQAGQMVLGCNNSRAAAFSTGYSASAP